jgi:hypothetical protein
MPGPTTRQEMQATLRCLISTNLFLRSTRLILVKGDQPDASRYFRDRGWLWDDRTMEPIIYNQTDT